MEFRLSPVLDRAVAGMRRNRRPSEIRMTIRGLEAASPCLRPGDAGVDNRADWLTIDTATQTAAIATTKDSSMVGHSFCVDPCRDEGQHQTDASLIAQRSCMPRSRRGPRAP